MEFWDLKQKKEISKFKAADTTTFEWSPDGEHVLTATVSPRLRVSNGYRLWHYTGSLLTDVPVKEGESLYDGMWRPVPAGTFKEKPIRYKPAEPGLATVENKKTEAYRPPQARAANYTPATKLHECLCEKTEAYRPPQARAANYTPATKLHEYEPASNIRQAKATADKPPSKNKKKRDARKAKATDGEAEENDAAPAPVASPAAASATPSTGDPETDKKIRNLRKKLQQIEKLKDQQKSGKPLELNQLEKLKMEGALLQEIEDLEIG
ncbi:hypothetical protein ACOMHN_026501 [Nucella lapillus]